MNNKIQKKKLLRFFNKNKTSLGKPIFIVLVGKFFK